MTVKQVKEQNGEVEIWFAVKDTGVGIKEEDAARIFDSFEQVSSSRKNMQGTGLGLSISSRLVALMGGKLEVTSSYGQGSEFYFTLKLPVSQFEGIARQPKEEFLQLEGLRILLAEDNDLNAEIASSLLELKGVAVQRVENGQQAVDTFLQNPPGSFDLILMDIQMPVKDGLEATAEIRANAREDAKTIPIVAMTANTFQEDQKNAYLAGMNGFVPKPFRIELLYQVLQTMTQNEPS